MLWLLTSLAIAGCEKDTDCKGDRICVEAECVDPPTPTAMPANPMLHGAPRLADDRLGDSRRRMAAGWSVGGCGTILGLTAVGLALAEAETVFPVSVGIVSVGMLGTSAPLAAGSGTRARDGLIALGEPLPPNGMRVAGWSVYGGGMGIALIAISAGAITEEPALGAVGFVGLAGAMTGITLLQFDANRARSQLNRALVADHTRREHELRVALAPIQDGAGVQISVAPRLSGQHSNSER